MAPPFERAHLHLAEPETAHHSVEAVVYLANEDIAAANPAHRGGFRRALPNSTSGERTNAITKRGERKSRTPNPAANGEPKARPLRQTRNRAKVLLVK